MPSLLAWPWRTQPGEGLETPATCDSAPWRRSWKSHRNNSERSGRRYSESLLVQRSVSGQPHETGSFPHFTDEDVEAQRG